MISPDFDVALFVGDCARVMARQIPDDFVDLVVTSPNYGDLRNYEGYEFDFEATAVQLFRVIKPGGVIVWVVRDQVKAFSESGQSFEQALFFKSLGLKMNTMFYEVVNPTPNASRVSYTPSIEFMFCFYKGRPKTTNWLMEPSKFHKEITSGSNGRPEGYVKAESRRIKPWKRKTHKWSYTVGHNKRPSTHPARFPDGLARDHILTWTNPGDIVLDPMCGSGQVGIEAVENNRRFIGIDIARKHVKKTSEAISEVKNEKVIEESTW